MKNSKHATEAGREVRKIARSRAGAAALGLYLLAVIVIQIVFLTLKISGGVDWSWWIVLIPILSPIALSVVIIVAAVLILLPIELYKSVKKSRRIDAEAEQYGMKRRAGESDADLKKRIVRRNMIAGNYTRKEIKDTLLETFPELASVQMSTNNETNTIVMTVRRAPSEKNGWKIERFTEEELREIVNKATEYIPPTYTVTIREAKEEVEDAKTEQ